LLVLIALNGNLPRYFLAREFTVREVGIFAALGYIAIAANTIVVAMGQAAIPSLARAYACRMFRAFLVNAIPLVAISLAIGIFGLFASVLAGQGLLSLLYGREFAAEAGTFCWLMLGGALGCLASATGYMLSSARCFQPQLPIMAVSLAVTAAGCYIFVPTGGLDSAAKAQAAGFGVQFLLSAAVLSSRCLNQFRRAS
jgi:O-antigen/teichoic acid export membrane protein